MTEIGVNFSLHLSMIQPKFLTKGDTVCILSTARKISLEEITPAIDLLKSWELNVVLCKSIASAEHQFAGSDDFRAQDLQEMLDNPNIKAIWCARGGYGTVRIIDKLDFSSFLKNPKWIIGYSDVTVLHSHIHNLGVQSLHATMPIDLKTNTESCLTSLRNTLFGNATNLSFPKSSFNKFGSGKGQLVGGNLSIFYSLLGSNSSINTDGKILFLEDLDEYLYHIDRMMISLKRADYFKNLNGLIIGGMTRMHDNKIPFGKNAHEIILNNLSEFDFPICFDFPAGHMDDNRALVLGSEVALEVSENGTRLSF